MMQFAGEYVTDAESAYLPEGVSVEYYGRL